MGNQRKGVKAASKTSIEVSFTFRGGRCRERIKLQPTPTNLKKAERFRMALLEAIDNGTFEYQVSFPNSKNAIRFAKWTGANTSIKRYLNNWLDSKEAEVRSSTFEAYERLIRNQIIPKFGKLSLSDLTRIDVKRWCMKMDCSVKRIRNIISVLRSAFQDAADDSLIQINPLYGWEFKRKDPPTQKQDEIDPFSKDEIKAILKSLSGQELNLVTFWKETGLRTSELIALEWGDIDFIKGKVHVWKALTDAATEPEPPKTFAGNRFIDLSETALMAITAQKSLTFLEGGRIFHNRNGESWTGDRQIREVLWRPALKKAGVRYRYPYQLRHTFASTRLMEASTVGEIMHVAAMIGHRDWAFTAKTYSRFIKDDFFQHQNKKLS